MSATRHENDELERLVDRHIELCELFYGRRAPGPRTAPPLLTMNYGKNASECFADLVDSALAAYGGSGLAEDCTIFALRIALVDAIFEMA
jgi:hypothetical protein